MVLQFTRFLNPLINHPLIWSVCKLQSRGCNLIEARVHITLLDAWLESHLLNIILSEFIAQALKSDWSTMQTN